MRLNHTPGNRQPQAGPRTFELGRAGRMQLHCADPIEFLKDQTLIGRVNSDAGIGHHDLDKPLQMAVAAVFQCAAANDDAAAIGRSWSQNRLLRGENGIAALTFCEVPIQAGPPK